MIKQLLEDGDIHRVTDGIVKLWHKKLEGVTYEADNVLDKHNFENLIRTVEIRKKKKPKVCLYFSYYDLYT